MMKKKVLYLLDHPIQYQSPLIKSIAKQKNIEILVVYISIFSLKTYFDEELNKKIKFDTNLVSDYNYEYIFKNKKKNFLLFTIKLFRIFFNFKPNIFWSHGYENKYRLYSIILAKLFNCKVLVRGESNFLGKTNLKLYIFVRKLFFFILDYFIDGYLCIGKKNREFYKTFIDKKKIFFMPYVVDNDFFIKQKNKNKNKKNKKLIFIYVGKLIEKKNVNLLMQAFKNLFHNNMMVKLYIIGDGILLKSLKIKYDLKNIYFKGFINQSKLYKYYSKSNVFVLPSKYEPWGLATNEAMIFSNALLLSSNVGCAYDFIKKNGYIFKNNCIKDLENKLYTIYQKRSEIKKMGNFSSKIINSWSINLATKNFIRTIRQII